MKIVPEITVILPGYNEAGNIEAIISEVRAAIEPMRRPYEIVWVDDGSTDSSRAILDKLVESTPDLRAIYHYKNFGQSAALLTGFQAAEGQLVATLDSDLQNDPADLPAMIAKLEETDVAAVCGVRQKRQDTRLKRFSSRLANQVRRWALRDNVTDAGCTLRVVRREALQQLPAFRALHRFLPTILQIHGYRIVEMPVRHRARGAGISKYGVGNRLWVGILDIYGMRWYRKRYLPVNRTSA